MSELSSLIQAVLFAAAEPVDVPTLTAATGHPQEDVQAALDELGEQLQATGLRLQTLHDHWQLTTAPESAASIKRYLSADARSELSRAALETLAMVAYRGPITRSRLDELRGVSSDTMIRNLLQRGLIIEHGRSSESGRTVQYAVSHRFLEHVGLGSLDELPALEDASSPEAPPHEA